MPSWMPLSRTAVCTFSVMSVTVRPPEVRSFVSSWKTFTAAIVLDRQVDQRLNLLLSREPAPGVAQPCGPQAPRLLAVPPVDRERAGIADAAGLGLRGRARDHRDRIRVEGAERRAVRGR